jgi:hypothetical protein
MRCDQLCIWARIRGFELDGTPADLGLLDQALDERSARPWASSAGRPGSPAWGRPEAGLFLGTVLLATVPGPRWRLWPNGHPVMRLPSGRDLDVVALAGERMARGAPLVAHIYAATAGPPGTA